MLSRTQALAALIVLVPALGFGWATPTPVPTPTESVSVPLMTVQQNASGDYVGKRKEWPNTEIAGNELTTSMTVSFVGSSIPTINGDEISTGSGASGDVVGPASAVDNEILISDGTTGKLLKKSNVTIDPSTKNITASNYEILGNPNTGMYGPGGYIIHLKSQGWVFLESKRDHTSLNYGGFPGYQFYVLADDESTKLFLVDDATEGCETYGSLTVGSITAATAGYILDVVGNALFQNDVVVNGRITANDLFTLPLQTPTPSPTPEVGTFWFDGSDLHILKAGGWSIVDPSVTPNPTWATETASPTSTPYVLLDNGTKRADSAFGGSGGGLAFPSPAPTPNGAVLTYDSGAIGYSSNVFISAAGYLNSLAFQGTYVHNPSNTSSQFTLGRDIILTNSGVGVWKAFTSVFCVNFNNADYDFAVDGDTVESVFYVDASEDQAEATKLVVGTGTAITAGNVFESVGNSHMDGDVVVSGEMTVTTATLNQMVFTPTTPTPDPVDGLVYYNGSALRGYQTGAGWGTYDFTPDTP